MAPAQTASLSNLQSVYSNKVAKLDAEQQVKKNLAVQEYGVDLAATLKAVQQAGDFDGYVLVEKEIARFKSEKSVPASSGISQLATSLAAYQKKLATFSTESAAKRIEIGKQLLEALVSLRKELMLQNKMKEAGEVNDAAKQVESDIREMESWQTGMGSEPLPASKPETKLDALFDDEPAPPKPKTVVVSAEEKKVETVSSDVKIKSKKGPPEAVEFQGHFYLYCSERLKWDTAKAKCQSRGGHLVAIGSAAENNFVAKLVRGKSAVWIGFYKSVDAWKWANLEKSGYENWGAGRPAITRRSSRMGVSVCAVLRGVERYVPSSYSNGSYRPSYTEASGDWEDAYSDAAVEGYVCEWDE